MADKSNKGLLQGILMTAVGVGLGVVLASFIQKQLAKRNKPAPSVE